MAPEEPDPRPRRHRGPRGRRLARLEAAPHRRVPGRHQHAGDDPDEGAGTRGGRRRAARELPHRAGDARAPARPPGALALEGRAVPGRRRVRGRRGDLLDAPGGVRAARRCPRAPAARRRAGPRPDLHRARRDLPVHAGGGGALPDGSADDPGLDPVAAAPAHPRRERGEQLRGRGEAVPGPRPSGPAREVPAHRPRRLRGHRAVERERGRRGRRRGVGADVPARRGPPPRRAGHRADRPRRVRRLAGVPAGRRRRRDRGRAAPGGRDARRRGRGRGRHGDHAEGGEREGRGRGREGGDRARPGDLAGGRPDQRLLRPDLAHRGLHQDRRRRAAGGRDLRHPGPVPVPGRAPHRRRRPLLAAVHVSRVVHRHGLGGAHLEPHVPRRPRLLGRDGRGRVDRRGRERAAAPRRGSDAEPPGRRGDCGAGGRPARRLLGPGDRRHPRAALCAAGDRGEDVRPARDHDAHRAARVARRRAHGGPGALRDAPQAGAGEGVPPRAALPRGLPAPPPARRRSPAPHDGDQHGGAGRVRRARPAHRDRVHAAPRRGVHRDQRGPAAERVARGLA